jgi:glycosyltransferase involved in cell wall biosynthesis
MNHCINNFKKYEHIQSRLIVDGCDSSLSPDITIVIPTYRRPHLIKETIASVIQQSKCDASIELVIVDNDAESTDGDLERVVSEYLPFNIRLFRNEKNIGMFGNWNRCIELARAPILTILNDDDLLHPDFIRTVYKPGMKEMRVVAHKTFSTLADCIWSEIKSDIKFTSLTPADFFIGNPVPGCLGMVMNKQCAINIGGYNESLWPTADYDFTFRYYQAYGLCKTKVTVSAYRWSENESLKVEALTGFLKNDYAFRMRLINSMQSGLVIDQIRRILCNMITAYCSILYSHMNSEFNVNENVKNLLVEPIGLSVFKIKIIHRLFGRLYPFFVKCIF